jgi:hypothetical protein
MRKEVRYVAAAAVALIFILLFAYWTLYASSEVRLYVWRNLAVPMSLSQAGGPRPDAYDRGAHLYYRVVLGALLLGAGGTASLLVLVPRRGFRVRAFIYLAFLAILLPASLYNFSQGDLILATPYQAALNLVIIFLGAAAVPVLVTASSEAHDTRVLKTIVLALILLGAVVVPAFFTILWLLWRSRVIPKDAVTWGHITGVGTLISVIIAWLNYRREMRKDAAAAQDAKERSAPRIIRPDGS